MKRLKQESKEKKPILKINLIGLILLVSACTSNNSPTGSIQRPLNVDQPINLVKPVGTNPLAKTISETSIPELQQQMALGQLSAEQLTQFFLEQIQAKNPQLNAIIKVNPKAMDIARNLDHERAKGNILGPLHGIPIIVKDNIETATMATTAGSLVLKDNMTGRDSTLVKKLKEAGAIILAKANLSEWANIRSERSSSGWSAVGGQTRNPHDINRSPCGSSSGSGAAVAANLAIAAIGTETNGSVVCPSSANGVVGIKPTVGLVSRMGIVPISHTQDTAGPMAKSVTDAAIILSVIQGKDANDQATLSLDYQFEQDFKPIKNESLQNKRIGILYSPALQHEGVSEIFENTKQLLKQQGAVLVDDLKTEPYDGFFQDSYDVLLYEFKHDLNQYLSNLPNQFNQLNLEKIIQFNRDNHSTEMKYFQQEIFEKSQSKGKLTEKNYLDALDKIRLATRQEGLDKLVNEHQLDVIISVTLSPAWSIDRITGDHYTGGFAGFPAIAGYPHITLPMGKVHHMPVGLSVTGSALTDKKLIQIAYSIENLIERETKGN